MNLRSLLIKTYQVIHFKLNFTLKINLIHFFTNTITESFLIYLFLRTDKKLLKRKSLIKSNNNQFSLELKPYGSSDCILQYLFVAVNLSKLGLSIRLMLPNNFKLSRLSLFLLSEHLNIKIVEQFSIKKHFSFTDSLIVDSQDLNLPRRFLDKVNFILLLLSKNPKIALSAVDSFVRTCEYKQFFQLLPFEENLFLELLCIYHCLESGSFQDAIIEKNDYAIMPDTSYLDNSVYRYMNEYKGVKIKILNPSGMYMSDLPTDESEFLVSDKRLNTILEQYVKADKQEEIVRNSQFYKSERLLGRGKDKDSQAAYGSQSDSCDFEFRKVLFLHVMRDANNSTSFVSGLFNTYFEWVEFMIGVIAKNNPDNWYIKLHPSSSLYENDQEIVETILCNYGLEQKILEPIPSTKIILDKKMPVFTHSGTIALETAASGYKSIAVGSRYPGRLVKKVKTYEELHDFITEVNYSSLVELTSEDISQAATVILYNDFGENIAFDISPNKSVSPSTDSLNFAINNLKSVASLIAKLRKEKALKFCLNIADEIIKSKYDDS